MGDFLHRSIPNLMSPLPLMNLMLDYWQVTAILNASGRWNFLNSLLVRRLRRCSLTTVRLRERVRESIGQRPSEHKQTQCTSWSWYQILRSLVHFHALVFARTGRTRIRLDSTGARDLLPTMMWKVPESNMEVDAPIFVRGKCSSKAPRGLLSLACNELLQGESPRITNGCKTNPVFYGTLFSGFFSFW